MILVDTGPLVALFDPADAAHVESAEILRTIRQPLGTSACVLTEAFHLLGPGSLGTRSLMRFVSGGALEMLELSAADLGRAFDLMEQYADARMDLADASLVALTEKLHLGTIFTLDRNDFSFYRIRRGHQHAYFEVLSPT